ncbi:MAG: response regulator [Usitatibacter sp.]
MSSIPGRGSVFGVRVPLGERASAAVAESVDITDNLAGRTVLVIDDEPAIRDAVSEVLRRWGCVPVAAANAVEAVRLFTAKGTTPDAMVVDYQLENGESGLDAILHLEAAFGAQVPAVVVTGDTQPERLREASDIGYPLLYKPLAPMRLRAALSNALQARAATVS